MNEMMLMNLKLQKNIVQYIIGNSVSYHKML